jgi:hypothetical protein
MSTGGGRSIGPRGSPATTSAVSAGTMVSNAAGAHATVAATKPWPRASSPRCTGSAANARVSRLETQPGQLSSTASGGSVTANGRTRASFTCGRRSLRNRPRGLNQLVRYNGAEPPGPNRTSSAVHAEIGQARVETVTRATAVSEQSPDSDGRLGGCHWYD